VVRCSSVDERASSVQGQTGLSNNAPTIHFKYVVAVDERQSRPEERGWCDAGGGASNVHLMILGGSEIATGVRSCYHVSATLFESWCSCIPRNLNNSKIATYLSARLLPRLTLFDWSISAKSDYFCSHQPAGGTTAEGVNAVRCYSSLVVPVQSRRATQSTSALAGTNRGAVSVDVIMLREGGAMELTSAVKQITSGVECGKLPNTTNSWPVDVNSARGRKAG
jgi:hypothetical protein